LVFGVGGVGFDGAGDDAESGEGEDDAGLLAEVFGVAGAVEVALEELDLVLELIGGEVLGEAGFLLYFRFGLDRHRRDEPLGDGFDDLADAGLGDFVFISEPPSGHVMDEVEAVNFEVAGGGGKGRCGVHERLREKKSKVQSPRSKVGRGLGRADHATQGCGLVWSI